MSFSLVARKLLISSSLLCAGLVAFGCAAPTEDVDTSSSALNDNGEADEGIRGWSASVAVTKNDADKLTVTATFVAEPTALTANGGVCLVTDLGLGKCDTVKDCDDAATEAGLPVSGPYAPGPVPSKLQHFCVAAGSEGQKRCWTRPGAGPGAFCSTRTNLATLTPNADGVRSLTITPDLTKATVSLSNASKWTAIGCLGFGAPNAATNCGPFLNQPQNYDFADHFITAK